MKNLEKVSTTENIESKKEKLGKLKKSLTLSAGLLAVTASFAEAQGQSDEEMIHCLTDTAAQNFETVKNRFPDLNQKMAAFAEARDAAMDEGDYEKVANLLEDVQEVSDFRYENFAYVVQMKDYCQNELTNLEVQIATADAEGVDSSDMKQKLDSLEQVVEDLEELQEGYRDL